MSAQPESTDTLASPSHSMLHQARHNVKAYGAVGDGVEDDTQAFQDAIDAGHVVYVPAPSSHYLISDKLTVSNTDGLIMIGGFNKGSGARILCNNFPANTDVFQLPSTGFPQLQLEDLFFDSTSGTAPRDFYRQTVADSQGVKWRNLYVNNMDGYGFNAPLEIVAPRFEDCNFIGCGSGGMHFLDGTAVVIRNCRFANAGASSGTDLWIEDGAGYTIDSPVFDGIAPGASSFARCKISGTIGVTIIQPYVEWTSASASGTLRNFWFEGSGGGNAGHTIIGGVGQVTPIGGAHTLTPVEIDSTTSVLLLNAPLGDWRGSGPYGLKVISSSNTVAYTNLTIGQTSVDSTSAPTTRIYSNGSLLRYGTAGGTTISGTTADCAGASWAYVTNGSATNMIAMAGGGSGHFITLKATNANTQIIDGGAGSNYFHLQGGANHTMAAHEAISFVFDPAGGGFWNEIGR